MLRRSRRSARRCCFESLESRQLMAGNVLVSVRAGHLSVYCDDANNEIEITGTAVPGQFQIRGLDGTTTVNGSLMPTVMGGVIGRIDVRLHGGNDRLQIFGFSTNGDLWVSGGTGDDRMFVGAGSLVNRVGVNLQVEGFSGNDVFELRNTDVGNQSRISHIFTTVIVSTREEAGMARARLAGGTSIWDDSSAAHTVWIDEQQFGSLGIFLGRVNNHGPGRNDFVVITDCMATGAVSISTYAGNDSVYVSGSQFGSLSVITSDWYPMTDTTLDTDSVRILDCQIDSLVRVATGAGRDTVGLEDVGAQRLDVSTSAFSGSASEDSDTVSIRLSSFDEMVVALGDDDDELSLCDVTARSTELSGGGGSDWLIYFCQNNLGIMHQEGFERFWSDAFARPIVDIYVEF
jgi:hypothetical protein